MSIDKCTKVGTQYLYTFWYIFCLTYGLIWCILYGTKEEWLCLYRMRNYLSGWNSGV